LKYGTLEIYERLNKMPHKKSKVEPELSFPDAPDFISRPPDLSLLEMIKLNESMLRY
jgi:hypothetical protein